jgi:hypothetical protein
MLDAKTIIKAINKSLEPFFIKGKGGAFVLIQHKSPSTFRLRISDNNSTAYNSYGNSGEDVKVVKWFDDFWLFVEISFLVSRVKNITSLTVKEKIETQPVESRLGVNVTLSVFQGEETDNHKVQLFRAEWDDYGDNSLAHAQPHWHYLSNKSLQNTVSSFADEVKDTFGELLKQEEAKTVDLSKFHFAMNGDWFNSNVHMHGITDEKTLASWFGGLLAHLKTELEYVKRKAYSP